MRTHILAKKRLIAAAAQQMSIHTLTTTETPHSRHVLKTVISTNQMGAARAALDIAAKYGIQTGGASPWNYLGVELWNTSNSLRERYLSCSKINMSRADATIIFRFHKDYLLDECIEYCRISPRLLVLRHLVLSDVSLESCMGAIAFMRGANVRVLNICGHNHNFAPKNRIIHDGLDIILNPEVYGAIPC